MIATWNKTVFLYFKYLNSFILLCSCICVFFCFCLCHCNIWQEFSEARTSCDWNIFQEILFVGIGNCVLRIDTIKLGRGKGFSADEPLKCPLEKLIDGVQLIGKHDGDVTDLSISQWMITRLVSASKDGTVCSYNYYLFKLL